MRENLIQQFELLPGNLSNHLMITVTSLAAGLVLSVLIAIAVIRRPRLQYPVLTAVSVVQTVPSLALLALMVPLLGGQLGFAPVFVALTLYSMLPITRNTVTAIVGVDPPMVEAARGVGMTPRQVLWTVELPLALPVIIAGIRTATVWVVGIATLATPVGQRCLGNYIFRGLQTENTTMVTFGCVAAALLAILLDLLIGGVQKGVQDRRRALTVLCLGALATVFIGGLIAPRIVQAVRRADLGDRRVVWLGSKTFNEQFILADLLADVLADAGYGARERESLGSAVIFHALAAGEIDGYVDYTGTIWANYMKRSGTADAETVLREVTRWVRERHGITCLGSLGFENAYGLAVRRETAERFGLRTIGDLAPYAPDMKIGGDYEFFGRPEWRAVRATYGLEFLDQISYDSTFMYKAVGGGTVDVISAFTSDGRIAAYDLVVLDDPKNAVPPYDAVLLLSRRAAADARLVAALRPLIGAIPIDMMRRANLMVSRDENKTSVEEAARWLRQQIAAASAAAEEPDAQPAGPPAHDAAP